MKTPRLIDFKVKDMTFGKGSKKNDFMSTAMGAVGPAGISKPHKKRSTKRSGRKR